MQQLATPTFFSGGHLDRGSLLRSNTAELDRLRAGPAARFIAVWNSRCMIRDDRAVLLRAADIDTSAADPPNIYLGSAADTHYFALDLPAELRAGDPAADDFASFGVLLGNLPAADASLLAYAKGMVEWHRRHRHCGVCGARNRPVEGGFVMICSNADCAARCFPRLDPAIIVLTLHEDRCLLGSQVRWPDERYSTIAGFVEPGEALEDAVRREVMEETNIRVGRTWYLGSQPWPFPNAIMLGFHAEAESTDIQLNDGELSDARWFSRETIVSGDIALPPPQSIAFQLIEHWFDQWDGQPLTSFNVSSDFRRAD